ncbi:MAG TPA: amino acid permease [Victivallales bacterium]|nr:amino acid permease [Victivallales bacterium]
MKFFNKHTSAKGKIIITPFALLMMNIVTVASLRSVLQVSMYGTISIIYYILAAILYFLPISLFTYYLTCRSPKSLGIYDWVKEGFNSKIGFLAIFIQWFVGISLFPIIAIFSATSFAYAISNTTQQFDYLMSNKLYLLIFSLVLYWLAVIVNLKGLKAIVKFCYIGAISGFFISSLIIIVIGIVDNKIEANNLSLFNLSSFNIFQGISNPGKLAVILGIFQAFTGLEISSVYGSNLKNPRKTYPWLILSTTVIVLVVFILTSLAFSIILPRNEFDYNSGFIGVLKYMNSIPHLAIYGKLLGLLLVIGIFGSICAWINGPNRGILKSAKDEIVPKYFKKTNNNGAPSNIILVQGVIVSLIIIAITLQPKVYHNYFMLNVFSSSTYLIMYIIMFSAGMKILSRDRTVKKIYKKYILPVGGTVAILVSMALIILGLITSNLNVTIQSHKIYFLMFQFVGFIIIVCIPIIIYNKMIHSIIFYQSDNTTNERKNIATMLVILGIVFYFSKYILNIIISNHLDTAHYGAFAFYTRIIIFASMILLLGTSNSAQKYLAKYFNSKDKLKVRYFVAWNIETVFMTSVIFSIILIIIYMTSYIFDIATGYFILYLAITPVYALGVLFSNYILSNKWPVLFYFFRKMALYMILIILTALALFLFDIKLSLANIALMILITSIIIIISELTYIIKIFREYEILKFERFLFEENSLITNSKKKWLSDSLKFSGIQILNGALWTVDFFIVEAFCHNRKDIGHYAAILVITNILLVIPSSITSLIAPRISTLVTNKKYHDLQYSLNIINLINMIALFITTTIIFLLANNLLAVFGKTFTNVDLPFKILCFAFLIKSIFTPQTKILSLIKTNSQLGISIGEIVIVIISGCLLTYHYGLTGISIAILISVIYKSIITYIFLKKEIPVKSLIII